MEKKFSKEQVKTILLNAPKGSDNSLIIEGLVNKGYVLEGFNDQQAQPAVQKPLTEKIGNVVSSVFPGDKIGNVIGTEIAKATATPEERQFIQQDVKPREIAGEVLQIGAMAFPFGKVANVASKVAGKTAGKIASGVAGGFMADVGFNLEDENKTLAEAFIPGVGTAIGAAIPAIGPVAKALKSTQTPEKVIGRVLQGRTKDVPLAKKAFENINLSNINTRQELSERLNQAMETQMQKVDEFLAKDPRKLSLDDYAIRAVNDAGQEVKTDFISNALNTLEDFYKNAGDELSASNVNLLKQRSLEEGLTHQEVNNLSRIYSEEFGKKAFSKIGEPLTNVNAQMFENTRKGLKQAARGGLGYGKEAQEADRLYSAMNNTKRIIDAGVEGVNKLEQRLKDYNVLQQLSRTAVKALNTFTGGSLKAGVEALGVSNVGNKIDNWVNLEKTLRKDLEFIQKANGINTEKGLVNAIEKWAKNVQFPGDKIIDKIDEASKLPNKQGGFVALPQSKQPAIQRSTTNTMNTIPKTSNIPKSSPKSTTKSSLKGKSVIPETNLINEAKKYKSAEKFIDKFTFGGEGSPLMHGTNAKLIGNRLKVGAGDIKKGGQSGGLFLTDNPDIAQVFGKDIYYADKMLKNQVFDLTNFYDRRLLNSYVGKTYKTLDGDIVKFTRQDLDNMLPNGKADFASISQYPELIEKIVKENGLKGVAFREYAGGKWGKTFQFFEDEIPVYSKSQLIDIWNKANNKK